jgi:hypothetical protein
MNDDDVQEAMGIVAALKVILLSDKPKDEGGGLNETNRKHAWRMARDLGYILLKANAPNGLLNLRAIMADQPYGNSALSIHEILIILENKGGLMPDEAVLWFRAARGKTMEQTK